MKRWITLFFTTVISLSAQAKTLVISDIDDTIKVSHVLSKRGASTSVFDDDSLFVGMSDIFHLIKDKHQDAQFHYVSLAPRWLMEEQHTDFLEESGFPITQLHMNPGLKQDPELKQKVIRKILKAENPDLVIYFGDNGQFDTVVYDQMVQEFPQIQAITYIREAYSRLSLSKYPTRPGQIGFVTSIEVVIDLIAKGVLPPEAYKPIENIVYKGLMMDDGDETFGRMVFPWWQDCRDFKWVWNIKRPSKKLSQIMYSINSKCTEQ